MSALPSIDASNGAYRERMIVPARTALLSIDMQQAEFNVDLLTKARTPSAPEAKKLAFYERIEKVLLPNQARLQAAARKAQNGGDLHGHREPHARWSRPKS